MATTRKSNTPDTRTPAHKALATKFSDLQKKYEYLNEDWQRYKNEATTFEKDSIANRKYLDAAHKDLEKVRKEFVILEINNETLSKKIEDLEEQINEYDEALEEAEQDAYQEEDEKGCPDVVEQKIAELLSGLDDIEDVTKVLVAVIARVHTANEETIKEYKDALAYSTRNHNTLLQGLKHLSGN